MPKMIVDHLRSKKTLNKMIKKAKIKLKNLNRPLKILTRINEIIKVFRKLNNKTSLNKLNKKRKTKHKKLK